MMTSAAPVNIRTAANKLIESCVMGLYHIGQLMLKEDAHACKLFPWG
jgi:hypothetical protein